MRGMISFLKKHFFEAGTALGGVISIMITIAGHISGNRSDKADFLFLVHKSYERVWSKHDDNPALERVMDDFADINADPVTLEEERFVLLLLNHITSTTRAIRLGHYEKPPGMEKDIADFFRKPVPKAVATKFFSVQAKEVQELLRNSLM